MPLWNNERKRSKWKQWVKPFVKSIYPQFFLFSVLLAIFGMLLIFLTRSLSFFWYGVQISSFFFILSLGIQWIQYLKRVQEAENIRFTISERKVANPESVDELYQKKYDELQREFQLFKQQMAEKNMEQMDYFTLWLHQIKTPISAMSLIVQKNPKNEESHRLEQELIRVNDYTHMALNYLKLEDSGKELDLREISVDDIIKTILKKYALFFIYKDISLVYEPTDLKVLSDRKWLEVLIEQLVSNSLKYTKAGEISIFFTDEQTLVIEDTGSGISKDDLPKIFEKGYTGLDGRLHNKSTGLGLFLSKKICRRLGHTLSIESELGRGTKAVVHFGEKSWDLFD